MSKELFPTRHQERTNSLLLWEDVAGIEIEGVTVPVSSRWLTSSELPFSAPYWDQPQTVYLDLHGFGCPLLAPKNPQETLKGAHTYFDEFHSALESQSGPTLALAPDWPGYNAPGLSDAFILDNLNLFHVSHLPEVVDQFMDLFTQRLLRILPKDQVIPKLTVHIVSHSMGARAALLFFLHENFAAQSAAAISRMRTQLPVTELTLQHTALAPAFALHQEALYVSSIFPLLRKGEALKLVPGFIWATRKPFQTLTRTIISQFGEKFGVSAKHPYIAHIADSNPYVMLEHALNLKNNPILPPQEFVPFSNAPVSTRIVLNAHDQMVNNTVTEHLFGATQLHLEPSRPQNGLTPIHPNIIISEQTGHTELLEAPAAMARLITSLHAR